jgi:hypothetical protein
MLKQIGLAMIVAAAVLSGGCLRKNATHTLYISPDDQVVWVAMEGDVRSDAQDVVERFVEERDYLAAAAEGRHPAARALAALAPTAVVHTRILRDERPFGVQIEARVGPIDRVLQRLFDAGGVPASVRLTRDAALATLVVRFDFSVPLPDADHPSVILLEAFDSYKLVLTSGAFVSATGWDLSEDEALLSKEWLAAAESAMRSSSRIDLTLRWEPR